MVVSLIAGGASMDAKTTKKTSKTKTSVSKTSSSKKNYEGTYKFTDESGQKWTLKLNSDRTATISPNNGNTVAYGQWWYAYNSNVQMGVGLNFRDQVPLIYFPAGEVKGSFLIISDGYLYKGSEADAKNPRWRLPISK